MGTTSTEVVFKAIDKIILRNESGQKNPEPRAGFSADTESEGWGGACRGAQDQLETWEQIQESTRPRAKENR